MEHRWPPLTYPLHTLSRSWRWAVSEGVVWRWAEGRGNHAPCFLGLTPNSPSPHSPSPHSPLSHSPLSYSPLPHSPSPHSPLPHQAKIRVLRAAQADMSRDARADDETVALRNFLARVDDIALAQRMNQQMFGGLGRAPDGLFRAPDGTPIGKAEGGGGVPQWCE